MLRKGGNLLLLILMGRRRRRREMRRRERGREEGEGVGDYLASLFFPSRCYQNEAKRLIIWCKKSGVAAFPTSRFFFF